MNALIRSRLPIGTAHEAMTTGWRYGGDDARAAGIVAATASEGEVVDSAVARAEELAARFALRATGKAFYICDATVPRQRVPEMTARGQQIAASHGLDILTGPRGQGRRGQPASDCPLRTGPGRHRRRFRRRDCRRGAGPRWHADGRARNRYREAGPDASGMGPVELAGEGVELSSGSPVEFRPFDSARMASAARDLVNTCVSRLTRRRRTNCETWLGRLGRAAS